MAEAKSKAAEAEFRAPYPKYLDWLRYLSAFLLFTYASSKMLGRQFTLPAEIALRPAGSLSGYQLAWLYYGHSHAYAVILGLIQLAGGALLLFRKTALLGAALTLPVMTNILMINVFFFIAWGALCTSAFIFYLCIHVGRPLAQPPCAGGRVLDRSSGRTGQCAALSSERRGVGCFAGHHLDGIWLVAQRRQINDFRMPASPSEASFKSLGRVLPVTRCG
jgi:hypothetical protein